VGPTSAGRGPTDRSTIAPRHHRRGDGCTRGARRCGVVAARVTTTAAAAVEERAGSGARRRAGYGGGTAPGQPGISLSTWCSGARFAPRHPAHLLGRSAAALRDGGRDRVVAEHSLHRGRGRGRRGRARPGRHPRTRAGGRARGRLRRGRGARAPAAGGGVEPGVGERGEILFGAHVTFDRARRAALA
jgi:hypothetical protein